MKSFGFFILILTGSLPSLSQLYTMPNGGNKKAMVGETIGITDVTIRYHRPAVKGRQGKIWGQLVHTGFTDQGFGTSKSAPWRAGANENTTIEFSDSVSIEGQRLPAGNYGLFIAYDSIKPLLILSSNNSSWGSFFYNESEDLLRVPVRIETTGQYTEWLKFEFTDQEPDAATIVLEWENRRIFFTVKTDYINQQLESFRRELRNSKGFNWTAWNQAAQFTVDHNINLEEGLVWAEKSINEPFVSEKNFVSLSTKAQILEKLNRKPEADAVMKEALPMAGMLQLHNYGRQLIAQKRSNEALEAFSLNYKKHPDQFTTNAGMMRGHSAIGNYKKAIEYARKAVMQAPDKLNKSNLEKMIVLLQEGKDAN